MRPYAPKEMERKPQARRRRKLNEGLVQVALVFCAFVSVLTTAGIVGVLLFETVSFFQEVSLIEFLTDRQWTPLFIEKHFGIAPLLAGTVLVASGAMAIALPIGLLSATYLSEYAPSKARQALKPLLEVLAGIPTVVYGYFALLVVSPALRTLFPEAQVFNAASASIAMGIMIVPLMTSLSEDAMVAVPRTLREAAHALGATRMEVATRVVVPASFSGIIAAAVLAASRAVGETMIVAIAAGQQPKLTLNPLESVQTMTAYIVQVSLGDAPAGTIEFKTVFAVGMSLFIFTLALNVLSQALLRRFREVYR